MVLTTDKAPALICVFNKLKELGFYLNTTHCTIKNLNNLIEQDHRHVKRWFVKSAVFQTLCHASRTIKGIETIQAIYKQRRNLQTDFAFSVYSELQQLMTTAQVVSLIYPLVYAFFKLCNRIENKFII